MILAICAGVALLGVALPILLRPLFIHRGMSRDEWLGCWPGDHAVPGARPSGSRSIFIRAPVSSVWPWLTQIGQDRAGFYSYHVLENLAGAEMPDIRQIVPEWSTREPGQPLVMAPVKKFGPIATMELVESVPNKHLIYRNAEGSWAFVLQPLEGSACRLTLRGTWVPAKSQLVRVARFIIFDPLHYFMEWKMARNIKHLVESRPLQQ